MNTDEDASTPVEKCKIKNGLYAWKCQFTQNRNCISGHVCTTKELNNVLAANLIFEFERWLEALSTMNSLQIESGQREPALTHRLPTSALPLALVLLTAFHFSFVHK